MRKEQITKDDGRYLIYFTFPEMPPDDQAEEAPAPAAKPERDARPSKAEG